MPEVSDPTAVSGAAEGRTDNRGEVVAVSEGAAGSPSREEEVRVLRTVESLRIQNAFGVDALRGHTRSHPEHDGLRPQAGRYDTYRWRRHGKAGGCRIPLKQFR